MIDRTDRWRRGWLLLLMLVTVTSSGFLLGRGIEAQSQVVAPPSVEPSESPPAPPPVLESAAKPVPVTTLAATLPKRGSGKFWYATTRGPVLGSKGPLRRFKVAVERGSGEDVTAFAEEVGRTLGDPRSWVGGGTIRLQQVTGADRADFTVLLATRETAGEMCQRGGTSIRVGGVPYTSCRTAGKAIINLDRWRLSATPFRNAKVPLSSYRQYVINHEVGHELGHQHQGCPRAGGPAPVMVQQTLSTRGCRPYPWPRRGNDFLIGPLR